MANALPQLDFVSAVKLALSRIKEMDGRSRRSEFWWTALAIVIVNAILSFIPIVGPILSICVWVVAAPLMIRRLHDTGRGPVLVYIYLALTVIMQILAIVTYFKARNATTWSDIDAAAGTGAISLLVAIPAAIIGIVLIVFWAQDSQPFTNQFGPSPKYPDGGQGPQQPFGAQPMYGQQPQYGPQQYGQQPYQQPQQPQYQQPQQPQQPYGQQPYGPQQPQQTQYRPQQPQGPQQ